MQDEVNQEDSEQNEVDGMKKGADSLCCEVTTQFPHRTPRHNQLLCRCVPWVSVRNIVVLSYLTHNTRICCVSRENTDKYIIMLP